MIDKRKLLELNAIVYFTAYPKNSKDKYICQGVVTKVPADHQEPYRVLIKKAGAVSLGGVPLEDRRLLINRAISKYYIELTTSLGPIFAPKDWIE